VTGDGVKVGIIDSGFDKGEIGGDIQLTRSFRETSGSTDHGTSVAEVVRQTAPDSQLYLISTKTGVDNQRAIGFLVNQDVDIIVYSIGWPTVEDDGDHFLTTEITAARQQGTLFVASAGNQAERHWEGNFRDTNSNGFLEWSESGDERNALPSSNTAFRGGEVTMFIRWEERGAASRYRAALYNPNTEQYLAVGQDRAFDTTTNRWSPLETTVSSQQLALVVQNTFGPADDEIEIVFTSGPAEIERNVPSSSITAPADVPAAVGVGAYERGKYAQSSGIASYSSRGPTDDGRRGVDVTGYTNIRTDISQPFGGTSAAAPYVGGVAALVEERQQGDASPADVEAALKSTSDDIGRSGPDTVSGVGVVNAADAVGAAATPPTPIPSSEPAINASVDTDGQPGGTASVNYTLSNVSGQSTVSLEFTTPSGLSVNAAASDTAGTFTPDNQQLLFSEPDEEITATIAFDIAADASVDATFDIDAAVLNQDNTAIDNVTTTVGESGTPGVFTEPLTTNGQTPTDPDGDGLYEDVNGDGTTDVDDVLGLAFVNTSQLSDQQRAAIDFDGDGDVDIDDVFELAFDA
jgi:Subtilase family.